MMKQEYKYWTTARETAEKYKYTSFATETAFEYKYQIAMETGERNTSKQVSAKKLHSGICTSTQRYIYFFFKQSKYRETESRKWNGGNSGS